MYECLQFSDKPTDEMADTACSLSVKRMCVLEITDMERCHLGDDDKGDGT